ncbi:MAG: hypothetical protein ACOH2N_04195 [Devosia sp.]
MTNINLKTLEPAARAAMVWTDGYDGQTHYSDVLKALTPAFVILGAVAVLMGAII